VPAGGIDKEIAFRLVETPLAEVVQLVGFALPDQGYREPAAALAATAAGAGGRMRGSGIHGKSIGAGGKKGGGSGQGSLP